MGQVNRYTRIQPERYQARTLQESMLAPAYMRKQHDAVELSIAETEAKLAQVEGLGIHDDRLRAQQDKLYGQLSSQADLLNKEGFNPSSKSDFLRLNTRYQQAVGPGGEIGKIEAAKASYETEKANLLANATKMGYGPEMVQQKLEQAYSKYEEEFNTTGKIANFSAPLPPAHEDLQKDILEVGKAMGSETLTKLKSKGYKVGTDEATGMFVIKTGSGQVVETSNDPNIQNAIAYLNSKWLDEGGLGTKSAGWQDLNPQTIQKQINSGLGLQREFKQLDNRQENYQFIQPTKSNAGKIETDFFRDTVQGYPIKNLSPTSPINTINLLDKATFDPNTGELIAGEGEYATYQEKVDAVKAKKEKGDVFGFQKSKEGIKFNADTGLYERKYASPGLGGTGINAGYEPITKDPFHFKQELEQMRIDNPLLAGLNDKELVGRISTYNASIAEDYINSIDIPGSNYEAFNDRLFGNRKGSGEHTTGIFDQKGATISGKEYTSKEVADQLGYDNETEFKELGLPTVRGFVPALGKYLVKVNNSKGEPVNVYIEGTAQLKGVTSLTRGLSEEMFKGTSFKEFGRTPDGGYLYFVNDFIEPRLVRTSNKVTGINQISNEDIAASKSIKEIGARETFNLINSSLFRNITGVKD